MEGAGRGRDKLLKALVREPHNNDYNVYASFHFSIPLFHFYNYNHSLNCTWQKLLCQTHHVLITTLEFADNCYRPIHRNTNLKLTDKE